MYKVNIVIVLAWVISLLAPGTPAAVYFDGTADQVLFPVPGEDDAITRYEWDFDYKGIHFPGIGYLDNLRFRNGSGLDNPPEISTGPLSCDSFFDIWVEISVDGFEDSLLPTEEITLAYTSYDWDVPGDYRFELTGLNLVLAGGAGGAGGAQMFIRESPTRASTGRYTITSLGGGGGGGCQINSFFDIFLEVSMDGGQTWVPGAESTQMVLVPEPATLLLLGLGGILLSRKRI